MQIPEIKVDDVPDDTVINALNDVDNRILSFQGFFEEEQYVIIHRIEDNTVLKMHITNDNNE